MNYWEVPVTMMIGCQWPGSAGLAENLGDHVETSPCRGDNKQAKTGLAFFQSPTWHEIFNFYENIEVSFIVFIYDFHSAYQSMADSLCKSQALKGHSTIVSIPVWPLHSSELSENWIYTELSDHWWQQLISSNLQ